MTPGARAAAAIECLDRWLAGGARIEPILRDWGRANRFAGSGDRRAIADIVYDCLRSRLRFACLGGGSDGRALVQGWARQSGSVSDIFTGIGHAPAALTPAESAMCRSVDQAPEHVRLDVPEWMLPGLHQSLGPTLAAAMGSLAERAPVDLRINRIKADEGTALSALREDGIEAKPVAAVPGALRCAPGTRIANARAYLDGLVEVQDAASQAAVLACAGVTGKAVLDYCTGGGGKALALASLTGGTCRIAAHDLFPQRMRDLPTRATRAGARIETVPTAALADQRGAFDLVFVDAPCSGSGTWRRDPEAKWALTEADLAHRIADQRDAFVAASRFVRPGGHIFYATCSLFRSENEDQVRHFMATDPSLMLVSEDRWNPDRGADGFYSALLQVTKAD